MEKAFFAPLECCPVRGKSTSGYYYSSRLPPEKTEKLLLHILCLSPATPGKKDIVNWALLLSSTGFYMKKDGVPHIDLIKASQTFFTNAHYEPTTIQTKFKTLFAVFSQRGICYSFLKDFNNQGLFY